MLNDLAKSRIADPAGRSELEISLAAHLRSVNASLDPHEQLLCLVVMREAWTVDNDLITPTLKVKRERIEARYARHYELWAASGKIVVWQDN